jgi:acyl carrier protein
MELCIAIEVHAGVSIVPDRLRKIGTLGRLVALIHGQR